MLNAAIVGLGKWGQTLVNSAQDAGRPKGNLIRFVRAVTRTPEKAAAFARAQGLPLGSDYGEVLADPAIEAVVLATPHSQHAAQIEAAAAAGKHVFVEKPFTLDKASAERAVAACRQARVVLAAGHNRRFLPSVQALDAMIERGELGRILHVEGHFSGPSALSYPKEMWRSEAAESPAGGMGGMGIHVVDSFIGLFGSIRSVQALSFRQVLEIPIDDTTAMLFRFANGMAGYLGTLTATARAWRIQAFGTKGWAHLRDPETMDRCLVADGRVETTTFPQTDIERAELEAFARAVRGEESYPVPLDQVVHGIAVFEAIAASATRDGAAVAVA